MVGISAVLAPNSRVAEPAPRTARCVAMVCVDPYHTSFDRCSNTMSFCNITGPDGRTKPISRIICQLNSCTLVRELGDSDTGPNISGNSSSQVTRLQGRSASRNSHHCNRCNAHPAALHRSGQQHLPAAPAAPDARWCRAAPLITGPIAVVSSSWLPRTKPSTLVTSLLTNHHRRFLRSAVAWLTHRSDPPPQTLESRAVHCSIEVAIREHQDRRVAT